MTMEDSRLQTMENGVQHDGNIRRLADLTQELARFARPSIERAASEFGEPWRADFDAMLGCFYREDEALRNAIKGYSGFVMDSMRRQKRFEQELRYPAKTYAEAAAEVYHNDDYMRRQYLPGLLLSHYLWPHHYQQIQYFRQFFLAWLAREQVSTFAEVGVGTGIYSRMALQHCADIHGTGFDISPMSLQFSQAHVASFGLSARYKVRQQNVIETPSHQQYRAVMCVEVLEHLEDPVALLSSLKSLCTPGGKLFVTAALNAADADHIYLYRQPQDVFTQVDSAGLHLEHCFYAQAYAPAKPGMPVPGALAMVLSPRS